MKTLLKKKPKKHYSHASFVELSHFNYSNKKPKGNIIKHYQQPLI